MDTVERKQIFRRVFIYMLMTVVVYGLVFFYLGNIPKSHTGISLIGLGFRDVSIPLPYSMSRGYDLIFMLFANIVFAYTSTPSFDEKFINLRDEDQQLKIYLLNTLFVATSLGSMGCLFAGAVLGTIVLIGIFLIGILISSLLLLFSTEKIQNWWAGI